MTLSLSAEDEAKIALAFREAWEKHGFGKLPTLMVRREQTITWGGKYDALDYEEFKKIICHAPKLTQLIQEQCLKIQTIARGAAKTGEDQNINGRKNRNKSTLVKDKKTGLMRRRTNRKKARRR